MELFKKIFNRKKTAIKRPEDEFIVEINDDFVSVAHPTRKFEKIMRSDISEIWIVTTDDGPIHPDVWMALIGENTGCLIPQGSSGWDAVYNIVSAFEGFSFETFIQSMSAASEARFVVWKKC